MSEEKYYQIALTCIPGIGNQTIKQLLSYCGSARKVFESSSGKLQKIPGIGKKTASLFKNPTIRTEAERKLKLIEDYQVEFAFYNDELFPGRLRHCFDSPSILFYKGTPSFDKVRILAIVGSRNATEYGKMLTKKIVAELKKFDPVIVSGLAYGIDIAAHKAALEESLITWSVIAGGHDKIYPPAHTKTYNEILNQGCIISEHLPETIPEATNFPERNRIIAGMSDATLVIEAKESGGALITADIANSYDREVFATPGQVGSSTSEGCHNLIKNNKAHLVTSGEDIAMLLGWDQNQTDTRSPLKEKFSETEFVILSLLRDKEMHIDDLSWRSGLPMNTLATLLLTLEMQGCIKALPGKRFKYVF